MLSPVNEITADHKAPAPPSLSRAQGKLRISFKRRGPQTVLDDFYQQGCMKARRPRTAPHDICEIVTINTAGGLTDGDHLAQNFIWDTDTTARITSQAAERIYRSRQQDAHIETRLIIGKGASAQYLPQECILFNGGRLRRANHVEMAKGARLVATESLVFGRTAMREEVTAGKLLESWRIRYDGELIFADGFHLEGPVRKHLNRTAVANGAGAMATLLCAGEDVDQFEEPFKQAASALCNAQRQVGCSLLNKVLLVRILADNGALMRTALSDLAKEMLNRTSQTEKADLPKVWLC